MLSAYTLSFPPSISSPWGDRLRGLADFRSSLGGGNPKSCPSGRLLEYDATLFSNAVAWVSGWWLATRSFLEAKDVARDGSVTLERMSLGRRHGGFDGDVLLDDSEQKLKGLDVALGMIVVCFATAWSWNLLRVVRTQVQTDIVTREWASVPRTEDCALYWNQIRKSSIHQ